MSLRMNLLFAPLVKKEGRGGWLFSCSEAELSPECFYDMLEKYERSEGFD